MSAIGPYEIGRVHVAESLRALAALPVGCVDAMLTDPPYSSGGFTRGDRIAAPSTKYRNSDTEREDPEFLGDNRDMRSWAAWCMVWLSECRRVLRVGGFAAMFSDWRMLPSATDAFQGGGLVWRGLVVWDKGEGARAPHTGYARHQAEFLVWGSNGPFASRDDGGPWPGVTRCTVKQSDKHHLTGKPTQLMRDLVRFAARPGALVLDPFAGSGTTGVACVAEGRRFLGFELSAEYAAIANERIALADRPPLFHQSDLGGVA